MSGGWTDISSPEKSQYDEVLLLRGSALCSRHGDEELRRLTEINWGMAVPPRATAIERRPADLAFGHVGPAFSLSGMYLRLTAGFCR
jgi:hypothetical protein